jgi:iron only hydrogenase large subunit-like protein
MQDYYHSVRLYRTKCKGCTNCIKKCPTEAIRVRDGKAQIIPERCIDCGECIRVCPQHAKVAITDHLSLMNGYKFKIALPAPSMYAQFKKAKRVEEILCGLLLMGFDYVFEVAVGAEVASKALAKDIGSLNKPAISSACPAIVRLIQVRFSELVDNIVPVESPMEISAMIARDTCSKKFGIDPEDIGVFFITPCPAKMTSIRSPIGSEKSHMTGAFSVTDVYAVLSKYIKGNQDLEECRKMGMASAMGVGWALSGGETKAAGLENALYVDGINNVIPVLEEMENGKLMDLDFFEGLACTGGCIGGPLMVENSFIGRSKLRELMKNMGRAEDSDEMVRKYLEEYDVHMHEKIRPRTILQLDDDIKRAMEKVRRIDEITKNLPGLDCGSCGAPSCAALAEDIVKGDANELDCIFKLKEKLQGLAEDLVVLASSDKRFH